MNEKHPDTMSEQELAAFYEARKGDISLWAKEPLEVRGRRGQATTSFAVRLTAAEMEELQAAATQESVTLSEFIRRSALAAARSDRSGREVLASLRDEAARMAAALDKLSKAAS